MGVGADIELVAISGCVECDMSMFVDSVSTTGDKMCGECACRKCVPTPKYQNPEWGYEGYCANPEYDACPSPTCDCEEPGTTPEPIPSPVTVYEHTKFAGRSASFAAGDYDELLAGAMDDAVSSIVVKSGYKANVYQHTGF